MKLIICLVALTGLAGALSAAPPGAGPTNAPGTPTPTPAESPEAAARKLLDAQYANEGAKAAPAQAAPPARTLPSQLNAVQVPPAGQAVPAPAPAPAQPAPSATAPAVPAQTAPAVPAARTNLAPGTPGTPATNRFMPRAFPAFPGTPVPGAGANTNTTATPVTPGAGTARAPGAPPGPGQLTPGAGGAAGAAAAPMVRPDDNEILPPGMIKFQDVDIAQVLEIYQELTGRTVLRPNSLPATKITIKSQNALTRAEAVHALDSILSMNQVAMLPQGEKFVKAVPATEAGAGASKFYTGSATNLPEAGVYVTHMIQLVNAAPNDLVPVLTPFSRAPNSILTIPSTSMLVLRDYAENVKRMVEVIEKIDVVPKQEFESVVIPIKYALAEDIVQVLSSLTSGGSATTVGGQPSRTGLSTGGGGTGFGSGRNQGGMQGQPGYNPGMGGFGMQQQQSGLAGGAGANRSSFQQRLQNIVNRAGASGSGSGDDIFVLGQTKIIADARINALLIFASKSDLVTISNIIAQVDVVLPQVLIEAVVLEVNLNNNLDYGFSYLQTSPSHIADWFTGLGAIRTIPFLRQENGLSNAAGGFTYAARIFDMDAAVTAAAGDGRGKILQRPRIQTSHAVEANLFVGESRPYPTTSYYGGGAFGGYSSIQQLQIGVTLSVLPLVNADGLVVMDIRQKVESVDGDVEIANVGRVPVTSQKEANAKVAVRDGETVLLGGFISNQTKKSHGGVPILKDIPLLGTLFRSSSESDNRRELMVMIRPTVLPTPESAATHLADERSRMPATKEAEADFQESERKLLEDTNRRMENKNYNKKKSQP